MSPHVQTCCCGVLANRGRAPSLPCQDRHGALFSAFPIFRHRLLKRLANKASKGEEIGKLKRLCDYSVELTRDLLYMPLCLEIYQSPPCPSLSAAHALSTSTWHGREWRDEREDPAGILNTNWDSEKTGLAKWIWDAVTTSPLPLPRVWSNCQRGNFFFLSLSRFSLTKDVRHEIALLQYIKKLNDTCFIP